MSGTLGASFNPAIYTDPGVQLSPTVRANLQAVDTLVRKAAAIVGAPVVVTSGFRTAQRNADVDGVPTSQHLDGTAADVVFQGVPLATVAQRLNAAIQRGELEAGQVVYYPTEIDPKNEGHVHLSLPTRTSRNAQLIHTAAGYLQLSVKNWPSFGVVAASTGVALLIALLVWLAVASGDE